MKKVKRDDIAYIQQDLEAPKHTLDHVLRPYKADVKYLRAENLSLRESARAKEREVEVLLRVIADQHPDMLDDALGALIERTRCSWKKFRASWRHRLGVEPLEKR